MIVAVSLTVSCIAKQLSWTLELLSVQSDPQGEPEHEEYVTMEEERGEYVLLV